MGSVPKPKAIIIKAPRSAEPAVSALAKAIEVSINQMFAQCELEPEADHALHGVLGQLLQGTAALKQGTLDPAAIASMRQALQDYPRLFDDPQWSALAPSDH